MAHIDIEAIKEHLRRPVSIHQTATHLVDLLAAYETVCADRDRIRTALSAVANDVHLDALANTYSACFICGKFRRSATDETHESDCALMLARKALRETDDTH